MLQSRYKMIENIKVSVIIPCYNQGHFIDEAVDSVLSSTYKNFEIIIVNDGSIDEYTNNLLLNYNKPNTRVVFQNNQGVSAARNNAIALATGEYILPLDGDDKIHPEYIEKAVSIFKKYPNIGLVYCKAELFGIKNGPWELPPYKFEDFLHTNCIFVSAFYKKSDWEQVGGYKTEMKDGLEDWEFFISLVESGIEVYQIPEALFYYRQLPDSRNTKTTGNVERKLQKQILQLHSQLYMDNMNSAYPLFKNIFKSRLKQDFSCLKRLFSKTSKQNNTILRVFGIKIKIWKNSN